MAQIGNLLNRNVTDSFDATKQAAGLTWLAVNISTPQEGKVYLSGIDALSRLSLPAETATLTNIRVEIFQNLEMNPAVSINVQLDRAILLWFGDTVSPGDRFFSTRFNTPWELDGNTKYSIVAFPIYSAALASIDAFDLTVLGVYGSPSGVTIPYYGKPR